MKESSIRVEISDMNNLSSGVGRLPDGRVVFVPGGVTGDVVDAEIIKENKKYCVARLVNVVKPSEIRSKDEFCGAPESCGGCAYRHVNYDYELFLKREYVGNEFYKVGLRDVEVGEVRSTGETSGYRNKAQFPVMSTKNGMRAGFYAAKTHRIVGGANCPLHPDFFGEIVDFICKYCDENAINAYDETTKSGALRHIYIRYAKGSGEVMVCLVVCRENKRLNGDFAEKLVKKFPKVVSVMLNYNREDTNVVLGERYELLFGKDHIEDLLLGRKFRIAPSAFWQVNHDGAELLYRTALEKANLTGNETIADLYCGTGSIGLSMSDKAGKIVGVEIVESAVECARENARINGVENAEFYCADASDIETIKDKLDVDMVVLDPPRKGSTKELIAAVAERGVKRVLYISCAPDTLARDCAEFYKHGYTISGEVTPVDMFPRTGHCEVVVSLTRNFASR